MAEDLSTDELLQELNNYFEVYPVREEGWIDYKQIARHMNISTSTVNKRMRELVEKGTWEVKKVFDPKIKSNIKVYRLKQNNPPPRKEKEG